MKYCAYCQRMVMPRKHINSFALIIMTFITGGLWLFIYVPYYIFIKSSSCPICGNENLASRMPPPPPPIPNYPPPGQNQYPPQGY